MNTERATIIPASPAWNRLNARTKQQAHKLRQALASALELHRSGRWGRAEIESAGLRDYQQVFGHAITPRHFWRLLDLVVERDAGRNQFDNLGFYLPGRIVRKRPADSLDRYAKQLPRLCTTVAGCANIAEPTAQEILLVWDAACSEYQAMIAVGMTDGKARRLVVAALDVSGLPLALTRAALRRSFCRKLDRWIEGGRKPAAIRDQRELKCGRKLQAVPTPEDLNLLTARALHLRSVPAAWRELLHAGELSPAVTQSYISQTASKSYCPESIRRVIVHRIGLVDDIHHGPRQATLNGAHITRDWSDVAPGDWQQADDVTLEVYYWFKDVSGVPQVLRGQFLLMIDLRSLRILNFALHAENNYNAKVIRGLMLRTHDAYGLPRRGYAFGKGIWKSSRLVKGRELPKGDEIPNEETELGFRDFALEFRHAKLPRAKPIERVIGLLQARLRDQPGWVGPNEMKEKFERVQERLLAARGGSVHPSKFFLHRDEWFERLQEVCDEYNNEPQQGRMLNGLSPRQYWEANFDYARPLVKLGQGTRYLLANHRRPEKVTRNGIRIVVGKEICNFKSPELGHHVGKIVQVYFDPEDMSSVFVMVDCEGKSALVVPREKGVPAMDATDEQLRTAQGINEAMNQPARTLYAEIKTYFPKNGPSLFRREIADAVTVELGQDIAAEQDAIRREKTQQVQDARSLKRRRRELGLRPQSEQISTERQLAALKLFEEARRDDT
ncbi:MAG: Mu transposase C-terminal domain-containing protein [Nibricoccus sp.]